MAPAAGENRGLPPLSIVGSFSLLPELPSVGGLVAQPACHLVLAAARASPAARHGDVQHVSQLATTPDGPRGVGQASLWPRCGVPELPPHVARSNSLAQSSGVQPSREASLLQR